MDEDAIDAEALQAQIDLSMSFAQNLVSSWVQPYKIPRNSHTKGLEKELSEYMQRPARLGVGASMPEGYNSATRETARLKGKLAGTKHFRKDDDDIVPQQTSDTEGESRAIAIKKRTKYDPFDVLHGKKKKKEKDIDHEDADPQPITANSNVTQLQVAISPAKAPNQCLDGHDPNSPILSPSKKKKKRKKKNMENCIQGSETSALFCDDSSIVLNPSSTPPRRSADLVDVSVASTPALNGQPGHRSIPLDFLTRPLLNLGPRSDRDSDHEGTPSSSPKKKRKRRRKKKSTVISSVADKMDETSNMS